MFLLKIPNITWTLLDDAGTAHLMHVGVTITRPGGWGRPEGKDLPEQWLDRESAEAYARELELTDWEVEEYG